MQALEVEVEVEVTVEVEVEVELVLAQPPLEQGRQWPAELVHELALTEVPAELVLGPLGPPPRLLCPPLPAVPVCSPCWGEPGPFGYDCYLA